MSCRSKHWTDGWGCKKIGWKHQSERTTPKVFWRSNWCVKCALWRMSSIAQCRISSFVFVSWRIITFFVYFVGVISPLHQWINIMSCCKDSSCSFYHTLCILTHSFRASDIGQVKLAAGQNQRKCGHLLWGTIRHSTRFPGTAKRQLPPSPRVLVL